MRRELGRAPKQGAQQLRDQEKSERQQRNGANGQQNGHDAQAFARQQRARHQAARYRRKVEERLFGKKADRGRLRLEERLREAGSKDDLLRCFREYSKSYGMPGDVGLLVRLLDLETERDLLQVTDEIERIAEGLSAEQKSLLRSRLRNRELSTQSDAVADAAATLVARL
jgi:hypothetical protein